MRRASRFLPPLLALCALAAHAVETGERFTRFAGFTLAGETTLADVVHRLGPAPLVEYGESGDYRASLCYRTSAGLLSFLSEQMGGSVHTLLGFSLAPATPERLRRCAPAPANTLPAEIAIGGLQLGMSRTQAAAVLGRPDPGIQSVVRRYYESQVPLSGAERADYLYAHPHAEAPQQWNVTISVFATFAQDRLTEFEIWKIRTP